VTIQAAASTTRSTRSNGSTGWVPFALVALVVVPAIAGSLRLVELAGRPRLLPTNPRLAASATINSRSIKATAKVGSS